MSKVYSDLEVNGQFIYNNNPQSGYVLTTDVNGVASWTASNTLVDLSHGNILYVAPGGSDVDSTRLGHLGKEHNPFLTLQAARAVALPGDVIYVFPQTFTFDNRTSNGSPYNGNQELINLWKNGVDYYFEVGCKIRLYNQTITGETIYLLKPQTDIFSTCNIYGNLKFETYSEGANTSFGDSYLYFNGNSSASWGGPSFEAVGNTCFIELDSMTSYCNELININRDVTISDKSIVSKLTIVANSMVHSYVQGQTSGSGGEMYIVASDASLEYNSYIRDRKHSKNSLFYLRGSILASPPITRSTVVNLSGDTAWLLGTSTSFVRFQTNFSGILNSNINTTYFGTANTGGLIINEGAGVSTMPWIANMNGNYEDLHPTSTTKFMLIVGVGNVANLIGSITTNKTSGSGKTIAGPTSAASITNITGDINYNGSGVSTSVMFSSNGGSTINYSGRVRGNFACPITQCFAGTITLSDGSIVSAIDGASSTVFENGSTTLGTIKMRNFYVEVVNNTNPSSNGSYVKILIERSKVVNAGSTNTLSNTSNFGTLQLENSTIISTGIPVNYTGTSVVVSVGSSTNLSNTITDLRGVLTALSDLIY